MACPARGKIGENNIVVHSRKEAHYQCKICGKTFAATSGTLSTACTIQQI
jgi:transposase-like protein